MAREGTPNWFKLDVPSEIFWFTQHIMLSGNSPCWKTVNRGTIHRPCSMMWVLLSHVLPFSFFLPFKFILKKNKTLVQKHTADSHIFPSMLHVTHFTSAQLGSAITSPCYRCQLFGSPRGPTSSNLPHLFGHLVDLGKYCLMWAHTSFCLLRVKIRLFRVTCLSVLLTK